MIFLYAVIQKHVLLSFLTSLSIQFSHVRFKNFHIQIYAYFTKPDFLCKGYSVSFNFLKMNVYIKSGTFLLPGPEKAVKIQEQNKFM
jgi:hypothetical protein